MSNINHVQPALSFITKKSSPVCPDCGNLLPIQSIQRVEMRQEVNSIRLIFDGDGVVDTDECSADITDSVIEVPDSFTIDTCGNAFFCLSCKRQVFIEDGYVTKSKLDISHIDLGVVIPINLEVRQSNGRYEPCEGLMQFDEYDPDRMWRIVTQNHYICGNHYRCTTAVSSTSTPIEIRHMFNNVIEQIGVCIELSK